MASSPSRLSALQRDMLEAFFAREQRFTLTGGAALAGFHFGHRDSNDLDLFGRPPDTLDLAERALADAALACGATLATEVRYTDFRRFRISRRDDESTLVDLVIDRAPCIDDRPIAFGAVQVQSTREIAANKVCTLLSRCELRDLVDFKILLESGITLEGALADAEVKDGGVNPATLAWLLSELSIAPDAPIPGDGSADELDAFRKSLIVRLRALALPEGE